MKEKTANTIRVERARHRLTQEQLAQKVGCSRQTIHAIENGKFSPGITLALKMVQYLNELKEKAGMDTITVHDIFKLRP